VDGSEMNPVITARKTDPVRSMNTRLPALVAHIR